VSDYPPTEIRINFLLIAFAIDSAIDVFPTPGGPSNKMILPFKLPLSLATAKNYKILDLTYVNP